MFNKRERNGILTLITLILILFIFQLLMPLLVDPPSEPDPKVLEQYLSMLKQDSLENLKRQEENKKLFNRKESFRGNENAHDRSIKDHVWEPHLINPNTANLKDWKCFGLSQKQAGSILNYVSKGGIFKVKSDVLKMYVVDEELYSKMSPFINLPDSINVKTENGEAYKQDSSQNVSKRTPVFVELNSADTNQLKSLIGIGSYYAKQIVKYREKLGGFVTVYQLYEVERMREATVESVLPFVSIDTTLIIRIKLNSATAPEMVKHPYITWNMAKRIHDYRTFTKKFKSTHELVELGLLNEELYSKLVVYIEL